MADSSGKKSLLRRLGPTGVLWIFWTAGPAISGTLLLIYIGPVSDWLLYHPGVGLLLYVIVFILAAGFGLLPTYAQSIIGGWVFGLWLGLPAALVGFTGGAIIGYAIARYVSKDRVAEMIESNRRARTIREALVGSGFRRTVGVIALLRLPINSPFALTNLVCAATGVQFRPFVLGTFIGMIPRTAVAVFIAHSAAQTGARDIQALAGERGVWLVVGGIVLMFAVLAVLTLIARQALARLRSKEEK